MVSDPVSGGRKTGLVHVALKNTLRSSMDNIMKKHTGVYGAGERGDARARAA